MMVTGNVSTLTKLKLNRQNDTQTGLVSQNTISFLEEYILYNFVELVKIA